MATFTSAIKHKRFQGQIFTLNLVKSLSVYNFSYANVIGTYKVVPKVEWTDLLAHHFGNPNWAELYPINAKGQPISLLSPRMACKLFYDGVHIIKRGEENPQFMQDHLPGNFNSPSSTGHYILFFSLNDKNRGGA